jgi:hypothetical protein
MCRRKIGAPTLAMLVALAVTAQRSEAGMVYQTYNEGELRAPFFWSLPSIGWYWTPTTNVLLEGIQTQLTTGFSNINNNFTFTTTLFTNRPAAGGTSLGSFTWNGATPVDGPWVGGSFAAPIALTAGTTYFVGMSGWQNALGWAGPNSGAGVNWVNPNVPSATKDHIGVGTSYGDAAGSATFDYDIAFNPGPNPGATEFPFLRFIAADPPAAAVPAPASITLLGGALMSLVGYARCRRKRAFAA